MQALAGIDTTQVYREFGFDFDQVKDLKLKQYFVHIVVVNWFEEILVNKFREFNFIKIIYERLYHFDINYVKCVEIYYDENDLERFEVFKSEMDELICIAQYRMPWRSDTRYYVCSELQSNDNMPIDNTNLINDSNKLRVALFEQQLLIQNLQNCLFKRYRLQLDWYETHILTVYQFKPNLNEDQLKSLEDIFRYTYDQQIFISEEFMFLKITEPPSVMYSFGLTIFHDQLLSRLSIEDILSLELANKDYRYEWYNCVLDCDIQTHLKKRFSLFQKQNKLKPYIDNEFTNQRLKTYFLYKYQDGIPGVGQLKDTLTRNNSGCTINERKSKKCISLSNSAIRFDIISPENITVYSITVLRHNSGTLIIPDSIIPKEIRLDSDISSILDEITNPPYFIEITIRAKIKSVYLTDILHKVLKQLSFDYKSIIQLRSYKNLINSCILNSFATRVYKFEIHFKNIIFDITKLVQWLSKCSKLTNINFTDCIFRLTDKSSRMLKMMIKQKNIIDRCKSNLTFRNMNFDISTFSTFLYISRGKMVYDGCNLTPSSSAIIPPKSLKRVVCKNMNIDFQVLVPLLPLILVEFNYCQIQSKHDPTLQVDSLTELSPDNGPRFRNMDIDAEVLLNISVYYIKLDIDRCCIRSNENIKIPSNYPTTDIVSRVYMKNVEIETKAAAKIFNRFQSVSFIRSRFVGTDLPIPKILVNPNTYQLFVEISITPEFLKGLTYLDLKNCISFTDCDITNQNLLEIWEAAPRCNQISIIGKHQTDYYFYFELIAKKFENQLDAMFHELKDGVPLIDFSDILWSISEGDIDWNSVKIRSVLVNDVTVKLEYMRNGEVLDLPYERYKLLNDLDICEVDYS